MKVFWRRGNDQVNFSEPKTHFCLGQVGTGKSTLLEHIGIEYLNQGAVLIDAYGSADGEGLAFLRSPHIKDRNVLLIKGSNVDVDSSFEAKTVENLGLNELEKHDLIISSRPLFLNRDAEYYSIGQLLNLIYKRLYWKRLIYLIAREASSLWYSRILVSEAQSDAKSEALYMLREMRHLGVALGLDTLRLLGIDIDLRSHTDYLYLKAQGIESLSSDLFFLYSYFDPSFIRNMRPWEFVLVTRQGFLGVGLFENHEWHKKEKENIVKACGLKIEYGEPTEQAKDFGTFKSVTSEEHMKIIAMYSEENLGMVEIASKLERSSKTVMTHIHGHNGSIERSGFCPTCKRANGPHQSKRAERTK